MVLFSNDEKSIIACIGTAGDLPVKQPADGFDGLLLVLEIRLKMQLHSPLLWYLRRDCRKELDLKTTRLSQILCHIRPCCFQFL
jgi:hypothetical protein